MGNVRLEHQHKERSAMRTKAILAAMVLALLPLPSVAQDFDVGRTAFLSGNGAAALREWVPLAEQGDRAVQTILGEMYQSGERVLQNHTEAVRWYRLAANQGFFPAQHKLGLMYFNGHGVLQNYVLAHMWANIAAVNGSEQAVKARQLVAMMMTPTDISEAQRLARVCLESNYQDCG